MRFVLLFFLLPFFNQAQVTQRVWTETNLKYGITKKLDGGLGINTRWDHQGLNLFFTSLDLKYKVTSWFKPSIEYRYLYEHASLTNYVNGHRFNMNADFKHKWKPLEVGLRLRYQMSFTKANRVSYDSEFDQAVRLRPSLKYNLLEGPFSFVVSEEWFYNPNQGKNGRQITKLRSAIGVEFSPKGPHSFELFYLIDFKPNASNLKNVSIYSVGYTYELKSKKKKKK